MPAHHKIAHHKINYVEFATADPTATRAFFAAAFGWQFEAFGNYTAFHGAGLDGGFYPADLASRADAGGALIVFYSADLAATERLVTQHGATIVKPVFPFPAGAGSISPNRPAMNSASGRTGDGRCMRRKRATMS